MAFRGHSTPCINDRVESLTNTLLPCYKHACPLTFPYKSFQLANGTSLIRLKGFERMLTGLHITQL